MKLIKLNKLIEFIQSDSILIPLSAIQLIKLVNYIVNRNDLNNFNHLKEPNDLNDPMEVKF